MTLSLAKSRREPQTGSARVTSVPVAQSPQAARLAAARLLKLTAAAASLVMVACGGGSSDPLTTPLVDGYGPGNPSGCPSSQTADVWLSNRLSCLSPGQLFISQQATSGTRADRAFMFGQETLDGNQANVLGAGVRRYFKYAVCVRNAPADMAPLVLAGDLSNALGLTLLLSGRRFYPSGVSASSFNYGGIIDTHTVQVTCDPTRHPVIADFATLRVESVNAGALSQVQVFDR